MLGIEWWCMLKFIVQWPWVCVSLCFWSYPYCTFRVQKSLHNATVILLVLFALIFTTSQKRMAIQVDFQIDSNVATFRHRRRIHVHPKSIEYSKCIQLESAGIRYCSIIQRGWRYFSVCMGKGREIRWFFVFHIMCDCDAVVIPWSISI